MIDLEALLAEATESPPCGPNLEHELAFFELEEAARGKPEQRIGDVVKAGEDPDWSKVVAMAQSLLLRSKDLRIAACLTRGLTRTEGPTGLAAGLDLIHGLLERYWDDMHPLLEVDQDNDPTERLNALAPLADPGSQPSTADHTLIKDLRDIELVNSREHGRLQGRDVEIALGRLAASRADGATTPKTLGQIHAQIAAAFATDRTVPGALRQAHERLLAIEALMLDRVGSHRALDLKPVAQSLQSLVECCDVALGTEEAAGDAAATVDDDSAGLGVRPAKDGTISTRDEAVRMLELVCRYLERHEPSNPAPLFIRRAQRLMTKNFVEIVRDLLPDSLSNLERLTGELESKAEQA